MHGIPLLPATPVAFPSPDLACDGSWGPEGLLAAGGELTVPWLVTAYQHGIFPWFDDDADHILWWSPKERAGVVPGEMRIPRSLKRTLRQFPTSMVTMDVDFAGVVAACAAPRSPNGGTWITERMRSAYINLHNAGLAHSVEVWQEETLIGGLYGVSLGAMFFGESMFSRTSGASKIAFYALNAHLAQAQFALIDCQMMNPHVANLGAQAMPRETFMRWLANNDPAATNRGRWQLQLPNDHLLLDESNANLN